MPIFGTPVLNPVPGDVGIPLITLSPGISQIFGKLMPAKQRGITVRQNQQAEISLNLLDTAGNTVDLTQFGFPASGPPDPNHTIVVNIDEALDSGQNVAQVAGAVLAPVQGQVVFMPPPLILTQPGIYLCEVGALNTGNLIFSNIFYLMIERGWFILSGSAPSGFGPPLIDEIRTVLRDQPQANRLTDQNEFDVAEICHALVRCVQEWNTSPPIINASFTTTNFPFRHEWTNGACAYLLSTSAHWFRRSHLPYQGGGLAIDDLNKFKEYEQAAAMQMQEWKTWLKMNKIQANMNAGFGMLESDYSRWWY